MLLRVILQNFLSFDEAVQFDMFPNQKRQTFLEHIYNKDTMPVLKLAAIYGANGAGKSNLIKGIEFMREFVLHKEYISETNLEQYFFNLKENRGKEPISLLIEFSNKESYFIYTVEISTRQVEKEELYMSGLGKENPIMIFERKGVQVKFEKEASEAVANATEKLLEKNPFSSLLALNEEFPIVEDDRVKIAYSWFRNRLEVIDVNSAIPSLLELLKHEKSMLEFSNRLFGQLDLGVKEVKINSEDFDSWISCHAHAGKDVPPPRFVDSIKPGEALMRFEDNRHILSIKLEDGIRKVSEFLFEQTGKNGYIGDMNIRSQSDGTVRLLTLIPAIYNVVHKDKTVFIDEINHCIHPSLVRDLVRSVAQNDNTKGQLVFTTHETCLLDQKEILRPDEVWFAEKKDGATSLYSLNDFKVHNSISIQNGYLEGRYGAIPFIGNLN